MEDGPEHDIRTKDAPHVLNMKGFNGKRKQKQLVFDRRYGWVYDEWRDPAQVALVGGRGMFCIVPLIKAAAGLTFQWANIVADFVIRVLESPSHPVLPQIEISQKEVLPVKTHLTLNCSIYGLSEEKPAEQSGLQYTKLQDKDNET